MLDQSAAYKAAITGDARRILLKAVVEIIDPDMTYGAASASGAAPWARTEQMTDKVFGLSAPLATLERNRWMLNGDLPLISADILSKDRQEGYVSNSISGNDGVFANPPWVQINFSNVDILQAFSIWFSDRDVDGVAEEFTVEVYQGGTAYYTKTVTGNTAQQMSFGGFTVHYPDAIRVTVSKWSLPGRRMRMPEILPGIYEEWGNDIVAAFSMKQQASFSCLALPYGTCSLAMDNLDRRFEPRNKAGIFQSITDRQGIEVSIGVALPDGGVEYQPKGIFYQHSGGWKTSDNAMTMTWELVDIVGLLAGREFLLSGSLPTTLGGWVKAIVGQLGENFAENYTVDAAYANLPLTVNNAEAVSGVTCGDLLRFACMATGTWPRADDATGYLAVEPYWQQGNRLTLDNLTAYPTMKANDDLAAIIFTLADANSTKYVVSGNATASSATVSVSNPFIHDSAAALTAARMILSTYGGNKLETTGRGDPSTEVGDVSTVELDESNATTGRVQYQTLTIQNGVLQGCQTELLQADGSFLFEERAVITQSGTWTAPAGVTRLRLILGNGGDGGTNGTDGTWDEAGQNGVDGSGGKILTLTINCNSGQSFAVTIGKGGAVGQKGGVTTFGAYSAADGEVYFPSYTDIASGDAFGRSGVVLPLDGTGDGGAGGKGGVKGNKQERFYEEVTVDPETGEETTETIWETIISNRPTNGTPGKPGASGFVVVYWDKEGA